MLQRDSVELIAILVITMWNSMNDVRRFAGDDPDQSVVKLEARAVLSYYDATDMHYGIVFGSILG